MRVFGGVLTLDLGLWELLVSALLEVEGMILRQTSLGLRDKDAEEKLRKRSSELAANLEIDATRCREMDVCT